MTQQPPTFKAFVCKKLKVYRLSGIYSPEEIITRVYERSDGTIDINTPDEVHFAWFKTTCLTLLKELSKPYARKNQFNDEIEKLFERRNPEARSLWASIERMLWQYRLRGAYDVKDVVIEAYAIGIKQIEAGIVIEKSLPWIRGTCFNVVRDLRRKQDKAEKPKLDSEGCTPSDEAWTEMLLLEDIAVMRLALQELSFEEQALLKAKHIDSKSWQQISDELNCSQENCLNANAVRQRGNRALQKLRQAYEDISEE
jgi:RNA polymerase sigma factor (sigma-70 family)